MELILTWKSKKDVASYLKVCVAFEWLLSTRNSFIDRLEDFTLTCLSTHALLWICCTGYYRFQQNVGQRKKLSKLDNDRLLLIPTV